MASIATAAKVVVSESGERRFLAEDGEWYIDRGFRKDGTKRDPLKCKAGYVPQVCLVVLACSYV